MNTFKISIYQGLVLEFHIG